MSEQIDWSKAPEGATVLLKHVRDGAYAVSESYDDEAKTWHWPDPRYSFNLMPSMWRIVAERPITPSWSGEGLPPVGVVCETLWPSDTEPQWYKFEVLFCGSKFCVALVDGEEEYYSLASFERKKVEFRPIRTPEQIAADKRKIEALKMFNIYCEKTNSSGANMDGFLELYDLGFRKP